MKEDAVRCPECGTPWPRFASAMLKKNHAMIHEILDAVVRK